MSVRDEWLKAHIGAKRGEFEEMLDHYLGDMADGAATPAQTKAWIVEAFENRDWVIVHREVFEN